MHAGRNHDHELIQQIRALLARPRHAAAPLERVEHTLTSGYAQAHALEAETWRLQRRVVEVTHAVAAGDVEAHTAELATLSRRITASERALDELRALLASLRAYASELRAA